MASILLGNVKGPQGDTGPQGNQGEKGDAATIRVGSVTTTQYGQTARVTNSGTEHDAVFDFVIPQGRPGEQVTRMDNLTLDALTEPSTQFPVPAVGDNGSTLFGKISKWFSDMAALVATKFPTSNVVNNLTTTSSGYALDARQGHALDARVAKIEGSSDTSYSNSTYLNSTINFSRTGNLCTLNYAASTAYIGAMSKWAPLFTIAEEYRPRTVFFTLFTDLTTTYSLAIQVTSGGAVQLFAPVNIPAGTQFRMYACYPVPVGNIS